MSRAHAQQGQQSLDEVQSLRQRLRTAEWHDEDWGRVERVLATDERVLAAFLEAPMRLKRLLTRVFGKRRRQRSTGADASLRDEAEVAGDGGVEVLQCHCLAHGRRKVSDLEDVFPQECAVVLETLKQVDDHDEEARDQHMSPAARLAYHQDYSQPLMKGLKTWRQKQCDDRLVAPNSALGKAMSYLLGHWKTLTRFLTVAGAPLDTNLVERALKLFIRQRQNSLFYRTEHSAYIASVLTSLIATCLHAGGNALDYLVALQEHRTEVFADPSAWLPWNYQASRAPP